MTLSLARLGFMGGISSGDLKLIETQTVSDAVANLSFDSIQETTYDDHFVTFQDFLPEIRVSVYIAVVPKRGQTNRYP